MTSQAEMDEAVNRLPEDMRNDVRQLLAVHLDTLVRLEALEVPNDAVAVTAIDCIVRAYEAALALIGQEYGEPVLMNLGK